VHLCKPCHRLKHQSSFTTSQGPGGALTWTTPTGKKYTSAPANTDPATYDPATYEPATFNPAKHPAGSDSPPPGPITPPPSPPPRLGTEDPPPF